jgi:hypothetical protein
LNGIDILVIVIVLAIVFVGANMLDKHEDSIKDDIEDEVAKARKRKRNGAS